MGRGILFKFSRFKYCKDMKTVYLYSAIRMRLHKQVDAKHAQLTRGCITTG